MVIAAVDEIETVTRARAGDRAAFQHLYESYLSRIYDYAFGMLRNRSDAEDVASETFLKAVERMSDLRDPAAFKSWLYAIARNAALRVVDGRRRAVPVDEHDASAGGGPPVLPQPDERAEQSDLEALFDAAASTLSERDRTVYDLSVRHGLSSAEIAGVLGVRPAYAYILVNRLKSSVTEALEAVLLARVGQAACADLARLVEGAPAVSPRIRKAVARHARSCSTCAETKKRRASVPVLMQGTAFAEPGAEFTARLSAQLDARWAARSAGTAGATAGTASTVAAGVVTLVVLVAGLVGAGAQRSIVESEPGLKPSSARTAPQEAPAPAARPEPAPAVNTVRAPRIPLPAPQNAPSDTTIRVVNTTNSDVTTGSSSNSSSSSTGSSTGSSSDEDRAPGPNDPQ